MQSVASDFDENTFDITWDTLSEDEKSALIENSVDLEPDILILPVLAGITSYHFGVRNSARKALEIIKEKVAGLLDCPFESDEYQRGIQVSASISSRLYEKLKPRMEFNDLSFFFKTLLEFQSKGAYFAFKAVYNGIVPFQSMEKILLTAPEFSRLLFVNQYIQFKPEVRLKFGPSFKKILKSVKTREPVLKFYASLFDAKKDADPFLSNIEAGLRDPDQICLKEIESGSPEKIVIGLKAIAMLKARIPSEILVNSLEEQEIRKIRLTVYKIIEDSSLGTYPKLFDPVFKLLCKSDADEAFQAFKALIITGKMPLSESIGYLRSSYPDLLPLIKEEISRLSKLSFFFIQDIALNKDQYKGENFDINLACVFGMIKKRPERVARLVKEYDDVSEDALKTDVARFIQKTKDLLSKEKSSIEAQFEPYVQQVKDQSKKTRGLIKTLFPGSKSKKLEEYKKSNKLEIVHFNEEIIRDTDISSSKFPAQSIFFNKSIFSSCDLSESVFINASFKAAILYNVDMKGAAFEQVNFDNSVFVNVNAGGAVFKNCSFQGVSLYNCNFNNADIIDTSFINSTMSKVSFDNTALFYTSFTGSKIAAVSFVNSKIDQSDFSYVKARFCRFPSNTAVTILTDCIDYNARQFQLSSDDMPELDQDIVSKINLLIFSEFIHYGEMKFLRQNRLSLLTAFDIFKPAQADFFQILPLLIHENIPFPGIKDLDDKTPHGICDYVPSNETIETVTKYISRDRLSFKRIKDYYIEGLFTIGSIGSVAQTGDSDIDWWVCINEGKFTDRELKLLEKKLEALEKLSRERFRIQTTFFLVDILKTKNNDFGDSSLESSGSAQSRLLKEEFYRTMIYIAGKIPLWSVLPTPISINYYNSVLKTISDFPELARYIDLGDIHAISTDEYVGASIWQMFKWLKSPFKSVIKMALLEKYIYEYGRQALLCNQYKDEWMNSGTHLRLAQNDSYYILLKHLFQYYRSRGDELSIQLLLTCFFLKLEVSQDSHIENTAFGLKKILIEKCLDRWNCSKDKVFEIGGFKNWSYSDILRLSNTIEKFMVRKYKVINKAFENLLYGGNSKINPKDRTVLGRKVLVEFSKQPGKVKKVLLVSRSDTHFDSLYLKYIQKEDNASGWELFNKNVKISFGREESLVAADTIEELAAWLINNGLYNEDMIINLVPNPSYVTFDDIKKLFKTMNRFFAPLIKDNISLDRLLMKNRLVCMFVSINFYSPRQDSKVKGYSAVYLNSWGEMFCRTSYPGNGFASMESLKNDLMSRAEVKQLPLNTSFYFSKGAPKAGS